MQDSNNSLNEYKGILEVQFPDNNYFRNQMVRMSDVFPGSDSIIIKSKSSSSLDLKNIFIKKLCTEIQNIDTSKISPEFLKGACGSGFCEVPTLRLSCSNENIIFLNPYDFQSQPTISITLKVSTCYSFIKYCESRDKKTGCMGCNNPYMIIVKKLATEMATNIK